MAEVRRRYVDTPFGQMHLAECGTGAPVLFLHQTPRSWTEYVRVLPIAGGHVRAIAPDTLGFGQSARIDEFSIERFADGVEAVLDALGLPRVALVGHHTGAVIALEVAARAPSRLSSLVLSAMPHVTPERRARMSGRPPVDHVVPAPDGGHASELWRQRRGFYDAGQEDDLTRFLVDALQVVDRLGDGHAAVNAYGMAARLPLVRTRTLLMCGADDPYALPDQPALTRALDCELKVIDGAGVHLPEQRPDAFTEAVLSFLKAGPDGDLYS
ncbi:alpha/beta fold hydrolase [Nonomuraea phyllanthi]|uniref:alpha/beta fold hydrolase n=1 Tax=Nonomuraea phyllanthi TaxID=2219224 RepID=UPI001293EA87|nr:alpha/beta hydrolase [Nonomuraea phyllanthi]QFY08722.1 alpha/beta fold hydrolase [Nonomuraea phyllanthi]